MSKPVISSAVLLQLKAVIFDLDGTLVDSALDFTAMCNDIGWPAGTPLLEQLALTTCPTARQRAHDIIQRHELAGAAQASWMPGAKEAVQQLHVSGMPLAILTRNMRAATQLTVERLQIPITRVLTREDCAAKPDPAGLLLLASDMQVPVAQVLYVGDYLFDLQAAKNAGMQSCLYLNQHNQQFAAEADWLMTDFGQLHLRG